MDNPLITLSQMGVDIHVFREHIPTWKPLSIVLPSEKVGGPNTYVCQDTLVSQGLLVFQDTLVWKGTIFCQVFSVAVAT